MFSYEANFTHRLAPAPSPSALAPSPPARSCRSQPRPDGYRYPNLLEGLIPVNIKNLFIFGVGQPRYGAGPLITAGAESIAGLLKAQADVR